MIYTVENIIQFREKAEEYGLSAGREFWELPHCVLLKVCNGIGAEQWSMEKRKALTKALSRYEVAAAIHDCRYEYHTCTKAEADKEFLDNMYKIWRKEFGWRAYLTISGWLERRIIRTCYYAVVIGGSEAWEKGGN